MPHVLLDPATAYGRHPLQPHQLVDRVTRTPDVIVLCHLGIPRLDAQSWSLAIDGMVRRPLHITLDDLRQRPRAEIVSIHECCGSPLDPLTPKRRITNVRWAGTRLADVLAQAEPEMAARFIWAEGADYGTFEGVACTAFVKDLPMERVGADVLLAYELNGAPLPPEHGSPVRLVVPGFYGTNSVKWLTRLTLADHRASGPFTTIWYNDPVRDDSGRPTGATAPIWSIAPESLIVSPAPDATLPAGQSVDIWGWAWADGGAAAVDISTDGGVNWQAAALEPPAGHAWQRFSAAWHPAAAGRFEFCSRARSADGRCQPPSGARNSLYRVPVRVR